MPVEYNWAADGDDLAKLKRESRRGEWQGESEGGRTEREGRQGEAEASGRISHKILTLSDV